VTGRGIARATGVAVLLAALGVAGGYAYAGLHASSPDGTGAGAPAQASGPAYPTTAQLDLLPESDLPPLAEDVPLVPAKLGPPGTGITLMVPEGWDRINATNGTVGARWTAPGNPPGSYSVRVTLVTTTQNPLAMVAGKIPQLKLDTHLTYLKFIEQTINTLVFTYVYDGDYRIEQVDRFVSLTGGPADVEIATSGRLIDDPGMRALVSRMATQMAYQPKKKAPISSR
jgi:hypothetical protein